LARISAAIAFWSSGVDFGAISGAASSGFCAIHSAACFYVA
jgi:hypothetical protein